MASKTSGPVKETSWYIIKWCLQTCLWLGRDASLAGHIPGLHKTWMEPQWFSEEKAAQNISWHHGSEEWGVTDWQMRYIMFADSLKVQGGMESGVCWRRPDHLAQKSKYTNVLSPSRPTDGWTPSFGRACLPNVRSWAACWGPPSPRSASVCGKLKSGFKWGVVVLEN